RRAAAFGGAGADASPAATVVRRGPASTGPLWSWTHEAARTTRTTRTTKMTMSTIPGRTTAPERSAPKRPRVANARRRTRGFIESGLHAGDRAQRPRQAPQSLRQDARAARAD